MCLNNNLIKQRHQKNFLNNLLASPVSSDEVYTDPYDPDINANLSVRQQVQPCTKINFVLNSNSDSLTNTPIIKTFHQISNAPSKSVASNLINQKQQNVNKSLAASSFITPIESLNQISSVLISDGHSLRTPISLPFSKPNFQIYNISPTPRADKTKRLYFN